MKYNMFHDEVFQGSTNTAQNQRKHTGILYAVFWHFSGSLSVVYRHFICGLSVLLRYFFGMFYAVYMHFLCTL